MGNCTSKKSAKSLKIGAANKPVLLSKMDNQQEITTKGLTKKVAPFTKGEITSFGFKKKSPSQLPVPVTLTSNDSTFCDDIDKAGQNGKCVQKNLSDGYQSGSSVESLCHAPFRSTPKMIRKRDLVNGQQQQISSNGPGGRDNTLKKSNNLKHGHNSSPSLTFQHVSGQYGEINAGTAVNRFGFRQVTPPRPTQISRSAFITGQGPEDTACVTTPRKSEFSIRSKSAGPKEAFLRQSSNSAQSGLLQSKLSLTSGAHPKKFTFQTSQLPRPQFPVRMSDVKTAKTAANYHRRGGVRCDSYSSKDGSINEDSGFESHPSANNTLEKKIEILDSSPGSKVRRRLPAYKGKKLEMKVVGNKFELMKKGDVQTNSDVVTEVSVIKIPTTNSLRTSTAVINTGLVEERTNQYLKRISQPYSNRKREFDAEFRDPNKVQSRDKAESCCRYGPGDEGLGTESEEEKLFKDSKRSEKYFMSDDCGEVDDLLPGDAMAEDDSFCLSLEDDKSTAGRKNRTERKIHQPEVDVTPNTIRLDALKLSKELKFKTQGKPLRMGGSSQFNVNAERDKDDETFPSDSILEQLSSDSDSLGDKGEDKNNDKEKNLKGSMTSLDAKDLGIDIGEDSNGSSKDNDTDVEYNELEMNADEPVTGNGQNNCLGSGSPTSPGTPTHTSASLSISDGRDFLIDDEIADQPQLCFSEKYVERSCNEDDKRGKISTKEQSNCPEPEMETRKHSNNVKNREKVAKDKREFLDVVVESNTVNTVAKDGRRSRLDSGGTLSPCESITSDDLMLDFENSLEETAGRLDNVNENSFVKIENGIIIATDNDGLLRDTSSHKNNASTGCGRLAKSRDGSSGRSTPGSVRCSDKMSSPNRTFLQKERTEDGSVTLDKETYLHMFQDVVSMKSMLLKLKRLLSESEGGLQENGRQHPEDAMPNNVVEDELADLRRQVLFLQQQLEEREKTVQVLKLKIDTRMEVNGDIDGESRKQCNAATQTGLEQFQQHFARFRIFQSTPVV